MARLSEQEKVQLLAAVRRKAPQPPPVRPARDFAAFASVASNLKPVPKSMPGKVRFVGDNWKL